MTVRLQVIGTNSTTLRAKAWLDREPSGWTVQAGDNANGLQRPGSIGVEAVRTGGGSGPNEPGPPRRRRPRSRIRICDDHLHPADRRGHRPQGRARRPRRRGDRRVDPAADGAAGGAHRTGGSPLALVRSTGEQLDDARSAAEQDLADGEQLRLVRADDAPPPPEVADVTDVVGDTYAERGGRWSSTARQTTGAIALGATTCVDRCPWRSSTSTVWALVLIATCCRDPARSARAPLAGYRPGRGGRRRAPGRHSGDRRSGGTRRAARVDVGVRRTGLGRPRRRRRSRSAPTGRRARGSGRRRARSAAAPARRRDRPHRDEILAVTAAVSVVVCGLLPWYALSASGLTGLDDQVLAGRPGRRDHVLATVDGAYRSLSWAAVAVALPLGLSAAGSSARERWAVVLGVTVIVLIALRTRAFPLIVQQLPLALAAIGATLVAVLALEPRVGTTGVAGLLIGFALLAAVGAGVRPAEHQRARLRRLGNFVEAVGMIGLIPLVLAVFGVYADLIGAFR